MEKLLFLKLSVASYEITYVLTVLLFMLFLFLMYLILNLKEEIQVAKAKAVLNPFQGNIINIHDRKEIALSKTLILVTCTAVLLVIGVGLTKNWLAVFWAVFANVSLLTTVFAAYRFFWKQSKTL